MAQVLVFHYLVGPVPLGHQSIRIDREAAYGPFDVAGLTWRLERITRLKSPLDPLSERHSVGTNGLRSSPQHLIVKSSSTNLIKPYTPISYRLGQGEKKQEPL